MASDEHIYRIFFQNQGQVYEMYAHSVYSSDGLFGFVEVEDYIFGEKSQMVIDPSEDKLRNEFNDVKRSFIPMPAVIRIDEVEKEGTAKITESKGGQPSNVTPFPVQGPSSKH